jgi:hypothetical protein
MKILYGKGYDDAERVKYLPKIGFNMMEGLQASVVVDPIVPCRDRQQLLSTVIESGSHRHGTRGKTS